MRVLPVLLSGYELRVVFGSVNPSSVADQIVGRSGTGGMIVALVLLVGASALLREIGRDLSEHVPRPRWSATFFCAWLVCAAAALACFSCIDMWRDFAGGSAGHAVLAHVTRTSGELPSLAAALLVGFATAAATRWGRAALRAVSGGCPSLFGLAGSPSPAFAGSEPSAQAPPDPVAEGWSSRGPPLEAAAASTLL